MTDNPGPPPSGNVISLRIEGEFADQIDRIAQEDGCSRSEVLRRMLLGNLDTEVRVTVRWIRQLTAVHDQLVDLLPKLESAEAWKAAKEVEDAADSLDRSIDALEDFEEEDE